MSNSLGVAAPVCRRVTGPRWFAGAIALAATLSAGPNPGWASESDPLVGKWWGTIGGDRERVEAGLEFRRDPAGSLKVYLTQPVSNYYGLEAPGEITREGNRVAVDSLALSLTLVDGRLEGTFPGPRSAATFSRRAELPVEPDPPVAAEWPAAKWRTQLSGQVYASPEVMEGVAYVGTTGGVFQAVDTRDGSIRWTFVAGRPIYGQALATADAVYFVCENGYLFRLARETGKEDWRYDLGDQRVSRVLPHPTVFEWDWHAPRPVMAQGVVFVGSGDGSLHAVDAATGARRWTFATGGKIRGGAAVEGERVVFGSTNGHVYALDRESGSEAWKRDAGGPVEDRPVIWKGKVLVGSRGASLHALALDSGEPVWRTYFWGSWVESTPTVVDGVLYIGSSDLRRVSALDALTGTVLWRTDVHGWTFGTPLVVGDRIYAAAAGGRPYFVRHVASLNALDRKTGKILRRTSVRETDGHQWGVVGSLALAGETVIATTLDGSIVGFPLP